MLVVNVVRWLLRRALFKPSPPCSRCGKNMDWGQPWRRSPSLAAFHHYTQAHMVEDVASGLSG